MDEEDLSEAEIRSWIRACPKCGSIIEKKNKEEKWKCKYCGWE